MEQNFDVVVIGSGLGGLLSAVLLAKEGKSVALIEQNKQLGGCLQTFAFRKKIFDSCVHYIGAMDEGQVQRRIFDYVGISGGMALERLSLDGYDRVFLDEEEKAFSLAQGEGNFIEHLLERFPGERVALQGYVSRLNAVKKSFPLYDLEMEHQGDKRIWAGKGLVEELGALVPEKLSRVLLGNSLLYAGNSLNTPFYVHALVVKSYMESAYKCKGGSSVIAKLLAAKLREYGGKVYKRERIVKVMEEGGVATQAISASGAVFRGRSFIANVHPAMVLDWIDSPLLRPIYRKRVQRIPNSIAAMMVNIVLRPGKVPYPDHNVYWDPGPRLWDGGPLGDLDKPRQLALYYSEDKARPGYADTLTLLCYMDAGPWSEWSSTFRTSAGPEQRGSGYEAFKEEMGEKLIRLATARFPELEGTLIDYQVASPLTFRDYMGSPDGGMYGLLHDYRRPLESQVPIKTKIPNLYFTGQNIGMHGVLGVSINAIASCGEMIGLEYLLRKIKAQG